MKINCIILCMMALLSHHAFSQSFTNNWCFGDSVGLNFSTDPPTPFVTSMKAYEASASMSDSMGNLLFYTNGRTVYNKEHVMMENGDSLEINTIPADTSYSSTTQGVIIIPKPESTIYYIFYLPGIGTGTSISYAEVDMNLATGLGSVIEKNHSLNTIDTTTEKMIAVKHANGRDWWLIILRWPIGGYGEGMGNPFVFTKYLITPYSINGPYYQDAAIYEDDFPSPGIGQMRFSNDGSKLVSTNVVDLNIYDFDRCSGEFSNLKILENVDAKALYGAEFSPTGRMVYTTSIDYPAGIKNIYQYCLECAEPIDSTKEIIYEADNINYRFGQMLLAPNGKIYVAMFRYDDFYGYNEINTYLSLIKFPEFAGSSCDFDTLNTYLGGRKLLIGLPNIPNYNLGALASSPCDTLNSDTTIVDTTDAIQEIIHKAFAVYPNPANTYIIITSHLNDYTNTTAEIYNAAGIKVKEEKIISSTQKINTEILVAGVYSIVIKQGDDYLYHDKFIIAR